MGHILRICFDWTTCRPCEWTDRAKQRIWADSVNMKDMSLKPLSLMFGLLSLSGNLTQTQGASGELTVRVIEADTKQLIAARLVLHGSDGNDPGDRVRLT